MARTRGTPTPKTSSHSRGAAKAPAARRRRKVRVVVAGKVKRAALRTVASASPIKVRPKHGRAGR